jgi:hypothetical protein
MPENEPNTPAAPAVNEHGYPDATPIADMSAEQQAAYWKHQSRRHEQRASAAPDAAELERLRAAEAELNTRKAADMTESERLKSEAEAARAEAEAAKAQAATVTAELLRTTVAADKKLTVDQAAYLQGSTKEELEASADRLIAAFGATQQDVRRPPSGSGADVGSGAKTVDAGAARYKARFSTN